MKSDDVNAEMFTILLNLAQKISKLKVGDYLQISKYKNICWLKGVRLIKKKKGTSL